MHLAYQGVFLLFSGEIKDALVYWYIGHFKQSEVHSLTPVHDYFGVIDLFCAG